MHLPTPAYASLDAAPPSARRCHPEKPLRLHEPASMFGQGTCGEMRCKTSCKTRGEMRNGMCDEIAAKVVAICVQRIVLLNVTGDGVHGRSISSSEIALHPWKAVTFDLLCRPPEQQTVNGTHTQLGTARHPSTTNLISRCPERASTLQS